MSEQLTNTGVSGLLAMLSPTPSATGLTGTAPPGGVLPFGAIMQAQGAGLTSAQLDANGQPLPQSGALLPPTADMLAQMQAQLGTQSRAPELSQVQAEVPEADLRASLLSANQSMRDGVVLESQWPGIQPANTEMSIDSPEVVALLQTALKGQADAQQRLNEARLRSQAANNVGPTTVDQLSALTPSADESSYVTADVEQLIESDGRTQNSGDAGVRSDEIAGLIDSDAQPVAGMASPSSDAAMPKTTEQNSEQTLTTVASETLVMSMHDSEFDPALSGVGILEDLTQSTAAHIPGRETLSGEGGRPASASDQVRKLNTTADNPMVGPLGAQDQFAQQGGAVSDRLLAHGTAAQYIAQDVVSQRVAPDRAAEAQEAASVDVKSLRDKPGTKSAENAAIAGAFNATTLNSQQSNPTAQSALQMTPGAASTQSMVDGRVNTAADIATASALESTGAEEEAVGDDGAEGWLRAETRAAAQANTNVDSLTRMTPSQTAFTLAGKGVMGSPGWNQALNERVMVMTAQNNQFAEIQLDPPELGTLKIRLHVGQDQVSVSFTSPHASVRDAVEQSMPRLREMMEEQGLSLGESSVNDQSSESDEDGRRQGFASQGNAEGSEGVGEVTSMPVSGEAVSLVDYYA